MIEIISKSPIYFEDEIATFKCDHLILIEILPFFHVVHLNRVAHIFFVGFYLMKMNDIDNIK